MFTDVILPILRLHLTLVFVASAGSKLLKPGGLKQTLTELGIPPWAAGPIVTVVIATELALAAGFWHPITARWAGLVAASMLSGFALLGLITRARKIRCNCFGELDDGVLGVGTAVRNAPWIIFAVLLTAFPTAGIALPVQGIPTMVFSSAGLFLIGTLSRLVWEG